MITINCTTSFISMCFYAHFTWFHIIIFLSFILHSIVLWLRFHSLLAYIYHHNCRHIRQISVCVCVSNDCENFIRLQHFFSVSCLHFHLVYTLMWFHRMFFALKRKLRTRFIINDVDRSSLMQQLLPINNSDLFPNHFRLPIYILSFVAMCGATQWASVIGTCKSYHIEYHFAQH